jgi:N-terminal domain of galactosyltransferase/N-terminal region of glycosyl transferase group 7
MSHKLGICIPYRNRKEHLERLVPHLSNHLKNKGIDHKFYVGHQVDDKLFNRGTMKNIAAKYAFEEGCDYIAWHDVDMLTYDQTGHVGGDYSYPNEYPIHIATKLSKYNYGLAYDQYFGGVVLFTKEQVEKTNGYSNEYWDWGQEDDDLFWRCYFEGYTTGKNIMSYENKNTYYFNGVNSCISIPTNREISSALKNDHTISILFKAEQQEDKVPIWLVGDINKKFIEYPLLRKEGSWNWGLSFNNSRAVTMMYYDKENRMYYNWAKKFENQWTWVTLSYSSENKGFYFYINDELISQINGIKQNIPFPVNEELRTHDAVRPFLLGFCPHTNTRYKGKIAEMKIYNKFFNNISEVFNCKYDVLVDINSNLDISIENVILTKESFDVIENIVPYRREGAFYCLPHIDEGLKNGTWAKGETTAKNERRFVTEMQQGKIDYKNDGINNLKYNLINTEMFTDNCLMINVTL